MVNIAQGMPGIVRDILVEAGCAMSIKDIADVVDSHGRLHARPSTRRAVESALYKRRKIHRDVASLGAGLWKHINPSQDM